MRQVCCYLNKRVAKSLPLFAGTSAISPFLTDEAAQLVAVKTWDEINERYFKQLDEGDRKAAINADFYRSQLSRLISADDLKQFDDHLEVLKERYFAYRTTPAYVADYWHEILNKAMEAK